MRGAGGEPGVRNLSSRQGAAAFRRALDMRDGHPAAKLGGRPRTSEVTKPHRRDSPVARSGSQMNSEEAIGIPKLPVDGQHLPSRMTVVEDLLKMLTSTGMLARCSRSGSKTLHREVPPRVGPNLHNLVGFRLVPTRLIADSGTF